MNNIASRVDALFAQWNTTASPGCMLAVIKDGEFVLKHGYGMADIERGLAISNESIFDIGSTGKQFTATVIVILANQGKLNLDDSIRKHIPEMPAYADSITIQHLIHHTSGLRDYLTLLELRGLPMENIYAEGFLLDLIIRQKGLNFKPGNQYLYSNSGYFLLGIIAERVTGKHITTITKEFILDPLGMKNTTFNRDYKPIVKNRAMSYEEEEGKFVNALALSGGFGDGALLSNVEDLLLWDNNFYNNKLNNSQADLIEQMRVTGKLNNGKSIRYAFGLDVTTYKGQRVEQHAGGWAGYRSEMMRFPDQRMTIICLANLGSMDPTALCHGVADLFLEDTSATKKSARKQKTKTTNIKTPLEDFTGVYQGKLLTYYVFLQNGELFLSGGKQKYKLEPLGQKQFQLSTLPITLAYSGNRNDNLVVKKANETSKLKRIQAECYQAPSYAPYNGKFYSPELNCQYDIQEKDGTLQFTRSPFDTPQTIYIITKNALRTSIGEFRIQFNKDGKITGFTLNAGRVKNIRFRKMK